MPRDGPENNYGAGRQPPKHTRPENTPSTSADNESYLNSPLQEGPFPWDDRIGFLNESPPAAALKHEAYRQYSELTHESDGQFSEQTHESDERQHLFAHWPASRSNFLETVLGTSQPIPVLEQGSTSTVSGYFPKADLPSEAELRVIQRDVRRVSEYGLMNTGYPRSASASAFSSAAALAASTSSRHYDQDKMITSIGRSEDRDSSSNLPYPDVPQQRRLVKHYTDVHNQTPAKDDWRTPLSSDSFREALVLSSARKESAVQAAPQTTRYCSRSYHLWCKRCQTNSTKTSDRPCQGRIKMGKMDECYACTKAARVDERGQREECTVKEKVWEEWKKTPPPVITKTWLGDQKRQAAYARTLAWRSAHETSQLENTGGGSR